MEIEAKYQIATPALFEQLTALTALGDYTLRAAGEQVVTDHYLDTAKRAFFKHGYACRLRARGDHWQATLKSLATTATGAVHQREELETEIPPHAPPADWPDGAARALVLRLSRGRALHEVCVIAQHRTLRGVYRGAACVAEATLDVVTFGIGEQTGIAHEMEIELKASGTPEDLAALDAPLLALGLTPQPLSKFQRALALAAAPKRVGARTSVSADDAMAEAGRKILGFHFARMQAREAGTRTGFDPEDLHAMRVATRRQRAALRLFAPYFKPKALRPLQRGLKQLAAPLGTVRDVDVLLIALDAYLATLADPAPLQALHASLTETREAARVALLAHLDSAAYRTFVARYQKILAKVGRGVNQQQTQSVQQALPAEVASHLARVMAYAPSLRWADVPTLHALRIEAKRLRYVLEFFREVLPTAIEEPLAVVVALQDQLGAMHDADVAVARVRAFLMQRAHPSIAPEALSAAAQYLQMRQKEVGRLCRAVGRPWRKLMGQRFQRALAQALAGL